MGATWEEAKRKRAFLDSQAILTRAHLDRAVRRDGFYTKAIAPLLNSMGTVLRFDPPGDLANVCAREAPVVVQKRQKPPYSSLSILVVVLVHLIVRSETALVAYVSSTAPTAMTFAQIQIAAYNAGRTLTLKHPTYQSITVSLPPVIHQPRTIGPLYTIEAKHSDSTTAKSTNHFKVINNWRFQDNNAQDVYQSVFFAVKSPPA
jgi:hypothetical protein